MYLDLRIENNTVAASHDLLVKLKPSCTMTLDSAASASTLTVDNPTGVAITNLILIGNFGDPTAEIAIVSGVTNPTSSVISLAQPTVYAHVAGTPVTVIDFDEVEFYQSATVDGAKTLLSRVAIEANRPDTVLTLSPDIDGYISFRFFRRSRYLVESGTGYYIVEVGSGYYLTEIQ